MRKRDVRKELKDAGYEHGDEVPVRVAAEVWGVSPRQIRQLDIEPARVEVAGMDCYTYLSVEQVVDLYHDPRVVSARERHQKGASLRNPSQFDDWRDALPLLVMALHTIQVHGYVSGPEAQERAVDLNRRLARLLYDSGYCEGIYRSRTTYEERICHECRGTGCELCADTGIWWPRREVEILVFCLDIGCGPFAVMGETHTFPWVTDSMITGTHEFPQDTVHDPDPWLPWQWEGGDQPVQLNMSPAQAYAIVEWVIAEADTAA